MSRIIARYRARPVNRRAVAPALFGGNGARARSRPIYLDEQPFADDVTDPTVGYALCPASSGMCPPFRASAEAWRDDLAAGGGTLPTDFLVAWIDVESGGNACNYTTSTGSAEAGIWQLMSPGNIQTAQTTLDEQHPVPPCIAGKDSTVPRAALSDAQASLQVNAGVRYVNACRDLARAQLANYGYSWSETDWSFWAMVKMGHVAPGAIGPMLQWGLDANGGTPPPDWDTMMQGVPTGKWLGAGVAGNAIPANWSANARKVGVFGQGGGTIFNQQYLVYGALAAGALALVYLAKKQARRVAH